LFRRKWREIFKSGRTAFCTTPNFGPLTTSLKADAAWEVKYPDDKYPAWQDYADECETLLSFAQIHGVLDRFRPRLCDKPSKRDEALAELRVEYFLESSGFPIVDFEPKDAGNRTLECSIALGQGQNGLVEVKSPGWESELTDQEIKAGRQKQPKYQHLQGRAAGPVPIIQRAVNKALPKFTGKAPTILFIADDCFMHVGEWGHGPLQMALTQNSITYGPGLFNLLEYATIGAVCLFWDLAIAGKPGIQYNTTSLVNPNAAPSAKIPDHLFQVLQRAPVYANV
jgi:hypothetical protein